MKNSIAIGEASVNREHGSIGEAYRFTSTTGYSMREGLENCYEAKVGGRVISHLAILTRQVDIKKNRSIKIL